LAREVVQQTEACKPTDLAVNQATGMALKHL
jgi:hypothetical protein